MSRVVSWLKKLNWKWRVLVITSTTLAVIIVVVPTVIYFSRNRHPPNYDKSPAKVEAVYQVSYDSGDGVVNSSKHTLRVTETGVKDSEISFHEVTLYDPYPKRKVNAIIVGSAKVTLAEEEIWRSENDLRIVHKKVMQTNLPIVNTAITQITYSDYNNYTGWPYHLNDSWTYNISYDTDVPFQPNWTDTFRADVVADDAVVEISGVPYRCFKVVNTVTATTNGTPPGRGVGATITEYWYRDAKSIGPIKIEDSMSYRDTETQTMTGAPPALPF